MSRAWGHTPDTPFVDVLVPTYLRPAALAVTLAGLSAQTLSDFRVVVSDQSPDFVAENPEVAAVVRTLRASGRHVDLHHHVPTRGLAEQRAFLLGESWAPYTLFLDDDLLIEPEVLERMLAAIRAERCGFVGCAPIGLSYLPDVRPHEQDLEPWEGPVAPETVTPGSNAWRRHRVHNAANVRHVEENLGLLTAEKPALPTREAFGMRYLPYHVAWVGGCVMYDSAKLHAAGGFGFWRDLPEKHAGEDVLAQLRVMARDGGCGILPSGVVHLELRTTVEDRSVDAPKVMGPGRT